MTDKPSEPFNGQSKQPDTKTDKGKEVPPQAAKNIRDKDNAKPELKPGFSRIPLANHAPKGMAGIKVAIITKTPDRPEPPQSIVKTHPYPHLLTAGQYTNHPDCGFAVQVNPYRTVMGIDGGQLTNLEIQREGKIIAQFQNGHWTMPVQDKADQKLVVQLQDQFEERNREFKSIGSPDKNRDIER